MDPDIAKRYGVEEVYAYVEDDCETYRFLDRSGKVRPVGLVIKPIYADDEEDTVRQAVIDAIENTLKPVFPAGNG